MARILLPIGLALLFLGLIFLLVAARAAYADGPPLGYGQVCKTTWLNVRKGPGLDRIVVGGLQGGTKVPLYEEEGGWYRIESASARKWVWSGYVCRQTQGATAVALGAAVSQPALKVGAKVYFASEQIGKYNPTPGYRNCCGWDVPATAPAGTKAWISRDQWHGHWRVTWNVSCRKYVFYTHCTTCSRWFRSSQFIVR